MKIGIFYGTTTGVTSRLAESIAEKLNLEAADIHDIATISPAAVMPYDALLLGTSTWGAGDLQDDWYDFLDALKKLDLSNKKVALFGSGDSSSFSDTFCDAIGIIYEGLAATNCSFIGSVAPDGYTFDDSAAVKNGNFVGLPLDEINESAMTSGRIDKWLDKLRSEGLA